MPVASDNEKAVTAGREPFIVRVRRLRPFIFLAALAFCTAALFLHLRWAFYVGWFIFFAAFVIGGGT